MPVWTASAYAAIFRHRQANQPTAPTKVEAEQLGRELGFSARRRPSPVGRCPLGDPWPEERRQRVGRCVTTWLAAAGCSRSTSAGWAKRGLVAYVNICSMRSEPSQDPRVPGRRGRPQRRRGPRLDRGGVCAADVVAGLGLWRGRRWGARLGLRYVALGACVRRGVRPALVLVGVPLRVALAGGGSPKPWLMFWQLTCRART